MAKKRRTYSSEFKARIALEALAGLKTASEIAAEHAINVNLISQWKVELSQNAASLFDKKSKTPEISDEQKEDLLAPVYKQVGKLQVENDWLKKKLKPYL